MEGKRGGRHCFGHENISVWSFSHMTEIRSQWPYGLVFLPVSFLRSLTHICVVNAEEEEERKGKRVQDERLVLFPAEHQTREAWRWRLPGARLADWIKECFLYNDARECSLKGDSECALHMMPCEDNTACWCDQQQNYNYSQINNDWTMKKVVWIKQVHMTNEYVSSLDSEVLLNIKMILTQKYPVIR